MINLQDFEVAITKLMEAKKHLDDANDMLEQKEQREQREKLRQGSIDVEFRVINE